ncbi:MAG: thermonuclease family protein, partial [Peptoniphilus sp.]
VHPKKGVEPWGKEASAFTTKTLENKTVYLEYDEEEEDHYGRKLAYIWIEDPQKSDQSKEDILFNYTLVRKGYARERDYPPNTKYQRLLQRAERDAIDENRGLWAVEGGEGPAKGNKNSHIYHLPGDSQYHNLSKKNTIYFKNAKEAEKAGFQRSFRR